jgi:hypothetical protein
MDQGAFDALTRLVASGRGTRRLTLRALSGALLIGGVGGVATRLGLGDVTAAKATKRQAKSSHKRGLRARKTHEQLQAQGRGNGKGRGKGKKGKGKGQKKPPPLPPGCEFCSECQMCQDGACVPDPALAGVPCLGSGATCSHCLNGVCTANAQRPCEDGVCARRGQCCPGEKWCEDHGSSTGFACVGESDCCPGQRKCSDGTCGTNTRCCPNEWKCLDGTCVAQGQCCTNERKCPDGSCVSAGACCSNEKLCPGGSCVAKDECCPGFIRCGDSCIDAGAYQCCGGKVCWKDSACCGTYCCPSPHRCCQGTCCFS